MAYLGQGAEGNFTTTNAKDTFSGNGSTTTFTLSQRGTENNVDVFVNNVRQEPNVAYNIEGNGTSLVFTAAPSSGTNNIYVVNRGPAELSASHPASQNLEAADGTFTGDLTVDTNTLYVDSTNNRVGINADDTATATSLANLVVGEYADTASGIALRAGTASALNFEDTSGSTSARVYYNHTSDYMTINTNASERMRINSSGSVGIGTVPPSTYWGSGNNVGLFTPLGYLGSNGSFAVSLYSNGYRNSSGGFTYLGINGNTSTASGIDLHPDANIIFRAGTASATVLPERMRIDSSGNVLVGLTSGLAKLHAKTSGSQFGMMAENSNINYGALTVAHTATSGTRYLCDFRVGGTGGGNQKGSITSTGTSVAYNTTSDYRLKENVTGITDGIERVKQLNPSRFNFIADADTTVDGFLAHEAQTVVPEAVHGEKDAVDAEGNPNYQGIDQAKLVPLLTAALQEAIAKIETLETKVAALEVN